MASLDVPLLTSWPRMRPGFENPFQNAPGRFIPALPNLAGHCRSISSDAISDCSLACPFAPFDDEHYRRQSRYYHSPPEAPPNSPEETVETARPFTKDADPEDLPLDDGDGGDNDSDSDDTSSSQHPQEQQSSSGSSTLTPSHTPSSPTSSESFEDQEEEDAEDSPKVKGRRKRRSGQGARRRRRNRQLAQQNGCVMGPRAMGIPGVQIQVWLQRSQLAHPAQSHLQPLAPALLPSAMPGVGHAHVLFPAAAAYCAFAVSGSSSSNSSPTAWLLPPPSHAALPVPGFFVG